MPSVELFCSKATFLTIARVLRSEYGEEVEAEILEESSISYRLKLTEATFPSDYTRLQVLLRARTGDRTIMCYPTN